MERMSVFFENKELKALLDLIDLYDESVEFENTEEDLIQEYSSITQPILFAKTDNTIEHPLHLYFKHQQVVSIFLPPPQV